MEQLTLEKTSSTKKSSSETRSADARRITIVGMVLNLALTFFKVMAGILGKSGAMVADAVHSLSDLATDVVVLAAFRYTDKPADDSHDYGHGKFETLASVVIGVALALVGGGIFYSGIRKIYIALVEGVFPGKPGMVAFVAAVISIISKEILYRATVSVGKRIGSMAVIANAWHHRSDSLSSVAAALGIGAAILGSSISSMWRIMDPLAAVVVAVFIVKVAYEISVKSARELLEESLSREEEDEIYKTASSVPGVKNPHHIKTRRIGSAVAVDLHIEVMERMSVARSHEIASNVEKAISDIFKKKNGGESFVSVHVEPYRRQ